MRKAMILAAVAMTALGGCTTMGGQTPIQATRYHLGKDLARGTIAVEPASGADAVSLEYAGYLGAVHAQLLKVGYVDPAPNTTAQFVAVVSLRRHAKGVVQEPSPFSIGLGAGGSSGGYRGGGVGLGGAVSFPIGRGRTRDVVDSELAVQIRARADQSAVWEGRAVTETLERGPGNPPPTERLADALFRGFPGESGITNTVR